MKIKTLNQSAEGLPLPFVRGSVQLIKATIPWKSILSDNCKLEVDGLELVVSPTLPSSANSKSQSSHLRSSILEASVADLDKKEWEKNVRLHRHLQKTLLEDPSVEAKLNIDGDESNEDATGLDSAKGSNSSRPSSSSSSSSNNNNNNKK